MSGAIALLFAMLVFIELLVSNRQAAVVGSSHCILVIVAFPARVVSLEWQHCAQMQQRSSLMYYNSPRLDIRKLVEHHAVWHHADTPLEQPDQRLP
jgi:hypothetical protein